LFIYSVKNFYLFVYFIYNSFIFIYLFIHFIYFYLLFILIYFPLLIHFYLFIVYLFLFIYSFIHAFILPSSQTTRIRTPIVTHSLIQQSIVSFIFPVAHIHPFSLPLHHTLFHSFFLSLNHKHIQFDVIHPAVLIDLNKQHRTLRLTQPVFDNYLYTTCFGQSIIIIIIIIICRVQKPKFQGKSVKVLRDLADGTRGILCLNKHVHPFFLPLKHTPIHISTTLNRTQILQSNCCLVTVPTELSHLILSDNSRRIKLSTT
jgi:hypothetical protein